MVKINSISGDLWLPNFRELWLLMACDKVKCPFDHVVLWSHMANKLCYIFISTGIIATKLDRVIDCNKETPTAKSHDSLIA